MAEVQPPRDTPAIPLHPTLAEAEWLEGPVLWKAWMMCGWVYVDMAGAQHTRVTGLGEPGYLATGGLGQTPPNAAA